MEPTLAELQRIVRAAGYELRIEVAEIDEDARKARHHARSLSDEERLRQNDRLSTLRVRHGA